MKLYKQLLAVLVISLLGVYCSPDTQHELDPDAQIEKIGSQLKPLVALALEQKRIPRTIHEGKMRFTGQRFDWTEGFFPGTCWYMYELTGEDLWKEAALELEHHFIDHRFLTTNHDLGFVFNCSFGHGFRLQNDSLSRQVLIDAANSLITRFNPTVGCIQSWDVDRGWQATRGWQYPVIVDNMMNLELLFKVSELTDDPKYREIAITHANTTLKNHFRDDGSSYHVLDYDTLTGEIRHKHTAQGFAHESAWARGQSWGLYGFVSCYQYTQDERYLAKAEEIADFLLSHPKLPKDKVPYWDFDADGIPDEPRDASAAAIMASALLQLDKFSAKDYKPAAEQIITSLSSPSYFAAQDQNKNFVLMHSVGSIPHGAEIDVPLNYADYYYTEAIYRLKNW